MTRMRLLRGYLLALGIFVLFWWPLSHWLYPDWYHDIVGFTATPDDGLVKIIGTIGVLPVLALLLVAWRPVRNRDVLVALLVLNVLLAATYVYLIERDAFPRGEYLNVALLMAGSLTLSLLYPWRQARA